MALLDVSDVLDDPDFADEGLTCTRMRQSVNDRGRATVAPEVTPFSGVVTSAGGDKLTRAIQGSYVSGSITIHTRFDLIAGAEGCDADVVMWKGRQYTVVDVNDYAHFGAGFVCATCELKPLSG